MASSCPSCKSSPQGYRESIFGRRHQTSCGYRLVGGASYNFSTEIVNQIGSHFGFEAIAVTQTIVFQNGDECGEAYRRRCSACDHSLVELLSDDMTLREQGFHGDTIVGLYRKETSTTDKPEYGLYIKVPKQTVASSSV